LDEAKNKNFACEGLSNVLLYEKLIRLWCPTDSPFGQVLFYICIIINNSSFTCFYFSNTVSCVNNITRCGDDKPYVPIYQVSKEKAKSLGIEFIPLEVSLKETVESLKEKKFINFNLSP